MLAELAPGPAWEALTAQAAMLAGFGAMLVWVLRVSAKKQDDALTQLVAMAASMQRIVEGQTAMAVEFRLRHEHLVSDTANAAKLLGAIVEELREIRAADRAGR